MEDEGDFDEGPSLLSPFRREQTLVGRNDPCPCGRGKKYKKCCLGKQQQREPEQEMRSKFPVGTIALYGPDDKRTTKIVAGVIKWQGAKPILKRWMGSNVKDNLKIRRELEEFFKLHGVKSVAASDRNMGCPHEEGMDFPEGGDCPFCPYWRGKQVTGARE